ncbi:glycoside hydrolase family 66 protein [Metabacillus dongyingensis]|uniref:glycoside hydrolase family 66 protein n=1 Tax=Metabacillus dongyingensis TaxID=2874282 RepID=UPI001CBF1E79|nr:glycoside hydrolase family 66 protein [Metabacillus dongyingensis]UAL50214.1 glycoside hydrolase family 66 protein [Metabacillus dongyingensis]
MLLKKKSIVIVLFSMIMLLIITVVAMKSLFFQTKPQLVEENKMIQSITTDKASYQPNEMIHFTTKIPAKYSDEMLEITYFHLNDVISKQKVKVEKNEVHWTWEPPEEDFKGYLVLVQLETQTELDQQTVAVDVSSDWSKFPRYGFLSKFHDMSNKDMESVISWLNRYHINGLQFYDWHYKHHQPINLENNESAVHWEDIANRPTSLQTIKSYIELAHKRNMKTMAYNLLYGAFAEAEKDGVKTEWRLFKDQQKNQHDYHPVPEEWKSDVFLVNPANSEWQTYLINQQKKVYETLPFDGWHIDQLGPRGNVYDFNGKSVGLDESFKPFMEHIKKETPDKRIVMNAVSQYGQKQLGDSPVDFLYTEVWDQDKYYSDLKRMIDENNHYSKGRYNTILAAYMNYEFSSQPGKFNTPSILLTNSVIFASGGSHLELGEHMLSKEYFPHDNLKMSKSLKSMLLHYYDFLVAYENLLRDNLKEVPITIASSDWVHFSSQPEQGKIWSFAKQKANKKVIHFINFFDATTLEWRDTNANQAEPQNRKQLTVKLEETKSIKKVWMASPDKQNGVPISLNFKQENNKVIFALPSLKYWDMVVVEYEQ